MKNRTAGAVAGLLLGAALAIAPATLRNHAVSGEWVPISTNYGINLYAGNHPGASGHDVDIPEFGTSFDHLRMVRIAEQRAGLVLADIQLADGSSGIDAVEDFFFIVHLPGLLRRMDFASMAASREARVPFADRRLVEIGRAHV